MALLGLQIKSQWGQEKCLNVLKINYVALLEVTYAATVYSWNSFSMITKKSAT